jgi:hypothetical protein
MYPPPPRRIGANFHARLRLFCGVRRRSVTAKPNEPVAWPLVTREVARHWVALQARGLTPPLSNYSRFTVAQFTFVFSGLLYGSARFRAAKETPALVRPSDIEQTEDPTMLQNFLDQSHERKPANSNDDLERAITQLRETLGINRGKMTTAYLVELRAGVEAVGRAIKEERWAREGYSEFLGE